MADLGVKKGIVRLGLGGPDLGVRHHEWSLHV